MKYVWWPIVSFLSFLPTLVLAGELVPCGDEGQDPCQTCHLYQLVENIFGWVFGALLIIASVVILIAGLRLATSGGNASAKSGARKMIGTAIVSVILVGTAWTLVDLLIATLYGQADAGNIWTTLQCVPQPTP